MEHDLALPLKWQALLELNPWCVLNSNREDIRLIVRRSFGIVRRILFEPLL